MKEGFSVLEATILKWFKDYYKFPELSAQIDSAKLANRKYTKVGFFVDVEVPRDNPAVDVHWPIDGPLLKSDQIEHDGGCVLWGENGYINCIEMYAFGDFFGENIKDFTLINPDNI